MTTQRERASLANRYVLHALLDRTSAGMVWLATDTVLDRGVTVTLIDPRVAEDGAARERLFANAGALATSPPTILVRLLDAGMDGDVPFFVTERVAGDTLAEVLERDPILTLERAVAIVADVLRGLAEAHAAGVLHLGVTPADVLLDDDGHVRLRNAGIAQAALAAGVADPSDRPSPPEGPAAVDARSDVWCAGVLLFELVAGHPPTSADAREIDAVPASRPVRAILARSLSPDPDARFPSAASMADALAETIRSADAVRDGHAASRRAVFRTWLAVPTVVALVAIAVVASGVWLGRLELGGPVGIRLRDRPPAGSPATTPLAVTGVSVVDPPPGDGTENDDELASVIDGDPTSVWRSENYFDGVLNKSGVGLLLDLGSDASVTGFRLDTPAPGFTFAVVVGDDVGSMLREASSAREYTAPDSSRRLEPRTGRYVLVWITSVVPVADGNRAEVSDIRLFGTA